MKALVILTAIILGNTYAATAQKAGVTGPHLLVYKTKKDYHKLVPVVLSEDKSKIISYPDPHDLKTAGTKLLPATLHGGYFMDNNGIGVNTAFLRITYTEYASLKKTPSPDELYKLIIDKSPLTTLYDCGLKMSYKDPANQMNQLIDKKKLVKSCKTLYP